MDKYKQAQDIMEQLASKTKKNSNIYNREAAPQSSKGFIGRRKIFVVFTDIDKNLETSLKELQGIRRYGIDFYVVLSRDVEESIDVEILRRYIEPLDMFTQRDILDLENIIPKGEGAIVPLATHGTASRLELGIQNDITIALLWKLLWKNQPVLVNMDNITIEEGHSIRSLTLKEIVKDCIKKLHAMGVETITKGGYLIKVLEVFNKGYGNFIAKEEYRLENGRFIDQKVITEGDILNMELANGRIIVPLKAIITPLASDRAKMLGIKIVRK